MDRAAILCGKDSEMLYEFSRRSLQVVHVTPLLSAGLSFFSSYLEDNVRKEVDKDQLTIREAAAAFARGWPACEVDLEDVFERTKSVDQAFLSNFRIPSFAVSVRYSDLADIRIQRIWLIVRTVYALLQHWPEEASFRDAVTNTYGEQEFREVILEMLHLYNMETRMLQDAIRSPFHRIIREYLEALYQAMETVMHELADRYVRTIYGDRIVHA